MFYYINGSLEHIEGSLAVIDVSGVGYALTVSGTTATKLLRLNEDARRAVKLYTYLIVREDLMELCGFFSLEELSAFKLLITISGVGPKAALSLLTTLSPEQFTLAVFTNDTKALSRANGIGGKTAARIILELKDKIAKQMTVSEDIAELVSAADGMSPSEKRKDAESALSVLGYSKGEIASALKDTDIDNMELEDVIKLVLKRYMKG